VPSVKVLMGIVGLYLAPFCYHSSFFFLRRSQQTAVPIWIVNVDTFCVSDIHETERRLSPLESSA
jgi:hypothetical protein